MPEDERLAAPRHVFPRAIAVRELFADPIGRCHRSHPAGRTTLQWLPCTTTCTPCRASHSRSSNPVSGPRGASGGARPEHRRLRRGTLPSGNCRSTRSRIPVGAEACGALRAHGPRKSVRARVPVTTAVGTTGGLAPRRDVSRLALQRVDGRAVPHHATGATERARRDQPPAIGERTPPHDAAITADGKARKRRDGGGRRAHRDTSHKRGSHEDAASTGASSAGRNPRRPAHGVASSRSCSTRAGPIPGMASSSSIVRNGPCASRQATIFSAVTGPDARQLVELVGACVDRWTFRPPVHGGTRRPHTPRRAGDQRRKNHLDAVGKRLCEIDGREIGLPASVHPPGRSASATLAPSASRYRPGLSDRPDDVNDERSSSLVDDAPPAARASAARCGCRRRAPSSTRRAVQRGRGPPALRQPRAPAQRA